MSKMLEQAIADAAALREQAIKNAEQSVIEKYSQQIKEAVDQMLEVDEPSNLDKANKAIQEAEDELIQEEEVSAAPASDSLQDQTHSPAWDSRYDDMMSNFTALLNDVEVDENGMVEIDLGDLQLGSDEVTAAEGDLDAPPVDLDDLLGQDVPEEAGSPSEPNMSDLEAAPATLEEDFDIDLQEVVDLLEKDEEEGEVVEEKIDYDPIQDSLQGPGGGAGSRSRKEANAVMADAVYGDEEEEESEEESDDEDITGTINELNETIEFLSRQNEQMERVFSKVETYLEETLLSNAKLLYQNRTLSDASLNERQKSKIVEAISNAESPKEAKRLHETLKATVGSTPNGNKGPQSLSESVNRRSNLSAMLNSRQNINESKQSNDPFMEKMQKLAGIKK